jgi:hypothetical protein
MENPILITAPEQLTQMGPSPWLLDPKDWVQDRPDAHWVLLDPDGAPRAGCSLWWKTTPLYPGYQVGIIGHFASRDFQATARILAQACEELARHRATLAVGPMDGNTWRHYRFVTEPGTRPPFFLEPSNPPAWPEEWSAAGFNCLASYSSRVNSDLERNDPKGEAAGERLLRLGVRLRSLDLGQFEAELERLYPLISEAFSTHVFYTPLPLHEFIGQHQRLKAVLRPELITIAEHQGHPVGLVFSVPDMLPPAHGRIDTNILKTLVISPQRVYAGLGSYLTLCHHATSRRLGYRHVIHALMHQGNKSQSISARYGPIMRRYALLAKPL